MAVAQLQLALSDVVLWCYVVLYKSMVMDLAIAFMSNDPCAPGLLGLLELLVL